FQLSKQEWKELIPIWDKFPENIKHSPATPFAFTEQGVAMLSSVLHSDIAIKVNISIMRAFVAVRNYVANNVSVLKEIEELKKENKLFHSTITELRKDIDLLKQSERKRLKEENKWDTVVTLADRLIHQQEITELSLYGTVIAECIIQPFSRQSYIKLLPIGKIFVRPGYKKFCN
ncbi:hypothetical protein EZS27_044023, partial [termite gut metagenome]